MHEMGIAASILETVQRQLENDPGRRATKVGLRIGEYAGVDPDSLRFCLDALVKSTPLDLLALEIDWRPATDNLDFTFLELEDSL
jgi:hydrogenase nickel incorporation protein HypA/HybF